MQPLLFHPYPGSNHANFVDYRLIQVERDASRVRQSGPKRDFPTFNSHLSPENEEDL